MKHHLLLLALAGLTGLAHAHHGQDFFVNLDARVPSAGGFTAYASARAGDSEFTLEPGLIAGLGGGFALGLSADFTDSGSFHAAGLTPLLQWALPLGGSPLRLGAAVSYHFADSSRLHSGAAGGHHHGGHRHASAPVRLPAATPGFGPGFNPDAPPVPAPQPAVALREPVTIHFHDTDYLLSRLIVEWEFSEHTRGVANLIVASTSRSDTALGYSLGLRHQVTGFWSVGLEGIGDFNRHGYHEAVAALIATPRHDLSLRFGLAHGIGPGGPGSSFLSGVTWRF